MAPKRPRLNLEELHQLRWLLGGLVTVVAVLAASHLEMTTWPLTVAAVLSVVAGLIRPELPFRVPHWIHKLAFPIVVGWFAFDLYTFRELLPALVRLGLALVAYRSATYRKRRDDLQLILLGLFLVVTAGVLTVALGFAFELVLFAGCALALLLVRTLVDSAEIGMTAVEDKSAPPTWTEVRWQNLGRRFFQVSDWRVWTFSIVLFVGLVGISGLLFVLIPRFQLENTLFLDRWMSKRSVTGFSDNLRFGEVSDIQKDDGVALRVEISDPTQTSGGLYWRMTVMDEYRDSSFHMSARLKQESFSREFTSSNINSFGGGSSNAGNSNEWTFYLEPEVSRYLPLPGAFSRLVFTEPQRLRRSDSLRILQLSQDPSMMKAYRISGIDTSGVIRERISLRQLGLNARRETSLSTLNLNFSEADREIWTRVAAEVTGGELLLPDEFSRRAIAWLHRHHTYSLQSSVPAGSGDALVRWAISNQPGHCELFAGAFTMIARSAGYPTRVVAGFVGGTWNGDYLIVRNSNAHAWCEIYDGRGAWVRVDPTVPPADASRAEQSESPLARVAPESTWSSRIDRLRMLWYRHIVNFEHQDQEKIVESLRQGTEKSREGFRAFFERVVVRLRSWRTRPWGMKRFGWAGVATVAVVGGIFFGLKLGIQEWFVARFTSLKVRDPIRRTAGRWLTRFEQVAARSGGMNTSSSDVLSQLQRLRYGPRETWGEPAEIFKKARGVFKISRRKSARRSPGPKF